MSTRADILPPLPPPPDEPDEALRRVRRQIEAQRLKEAKRQPRVGELLARCQAIVTAVAQGDAVLLRGGLVDLAALCEAWASRLPERRGA